MPNSIPITDLWVRALDQYHKPKFADPVARTMAVKAEQTPLGRQLVIITQASDALLSADIADLTGSEALVLSVVMQQTIDLLTARLRQVEQLFR
jgi:hypothetical protein